MKQNPKRLLSLALALTMALSTTITSSLAWNQTAAALTTASVTTMAAPTSGKCGKNVTWKYNAKTKTVTISGKGDMYNYKSWGDGVAPWLADDNELNIQKVAVQSGVTSIGSYAFQYAQVKSVSLPATLTKIGKSAFASCRKLTAITLPRNLKNLASDAFVGAGLKAYQVDKKNKYFTVVKGVLFDKKKTTLLSYPEWKKDTSYTIPKNVKTIGAYAFATDFDYRAKLKKLTVPASVKTVKSHAFEGFIGKIYFKGKVPKGMKGAITYEGYCTIYYPKKYASNWKSTKKVLESIDLDDCGVTCKTWKG